VELELELEMEVEVEVVDWASEFLMMLHTLAKDFQI
jgi:hypothetical protein